MYQRIDIISAKQVSIQQPLCEEWMTSPVVPSGQFVRAIDPDFRQFVTPGESRRLGKLLKRALATSLSALEEGGIRNPDAIITGTGFGSIENTELFLDALVREGEQMLKPTQFMQSTHNTASSLIGINTKSHGYNSTYSQKGLSFDSALYDAWLQFRLGKIGNALVGAHDEMSPVFSGFMTKAGHVMQGETCSEAAVSVLLEADSTKPSMCTLEDVRILNRPTSEELSQVLSQMKADVCMTGRSGNAGNDALYDFLGDDVPQCSYKPLFGVNFSSSAIGFYAAACSLKAGHVPSVLNGGRGDVPCSSILLVNVVGGRHYSFVLLKAICGR